VKNLREVIQDTINVWGIVSFPEIITLMEKRFHQIQKDIVWSIVESMLMDGEIAQNINYTFSPSEYWESAY